MRTVSLIQDLKVEKPIDQEGLKRAKSSAQTNRKRPESYYVQLDKKGNHSTLIATFGKDLKGLIPVGNPCSVAGEDIPEVLPDCVPCIYHPIFFWDIKKSFEFWSPESEVSTLTPADASGLTVQSTNVGTHKIDGPILKLFSRVQVEDKLKEARLLFEETFLVID